jgi:hypothetical protein
LPIFGEKLAFFSKTNVMIKLFLNLALFRVQSANFLADFLGRIFKIIKSVPDRADFRLLGDCLLWVVFAKIAEVAPMTGLPFLRGKICVWRAAGAQRLSDGIRK